MRLIDADALKDDFDCIGFNDYDDYNRALRIIDNAPTIEERPKGKWIYKEFDVESGISHSYWCSNCGEPKSQWCDDFCQRCGADMRKEEQNADKT